jgi:PAS domain S-box-containing protein
MDTPALGQAPILIVDDHAANLLAMEALLEPLGQPIVRANSGEEAVRRIGEDEFAVILLDVRMPGMDGFETAKRIRKREKGRHVPIIFVTADEAYGEDYAHRAYSQGAIDFLVKPFKPATVLSKVGVLVDLHLRGEMIRQQQEAVRRAERDAVERQSETRLRTLIDLMPLCVIALHADGMPYFCNRAWREYTGIDLDRASPQALFEAIHADDRPFVREILQGALVGGRAVELECRLRGGADGAFRWHIVRAMPEFGAEGVVVGWIATATDVDRQRNSERQVTA